MDMNAYEWAAPPLPSHEGGRDRTRNVQGGSGSTFGEPSGGSPLAPSDRLRRSVSPDFAGERRAGGVYWHPADKRTLRTSEMGG